jgi:hypothetical protein
VDIETIAVPIKRNSNSRKFIANKLIITWRTSFRENDLS